MSIDMMKQISQAEAQAVQLRADAQAEAKRAVDAGRKEAAAMVEAARKKADQAYREVMDQAEKAAQRDYNDYLEAVKTECETMKTLAQGHKEEAVKLIIGKVVG